MLDKSSLASHWQQNLIIKSKVTSLLVQGFFSEYLCWLLQSISFLFTNTKKKKKNWTELEWSMISILMFVNPLKISLSQFEDYDIAASACTTCDFRHLHTSVPKKRRFSSFNSFSFEPQHNPWLAWYDPPGSYITGTKASKGLPLKLYYS